MDAQSIYEVLKHGTAAERQALRQSLPPDPMRDIAAGMLDSNNIGMTVVALGSVTISYCNGREPAVGADLTWALHQLAVELFTETKDSGLLPTTLSGFAQSYIKASNLLGRSEEAVKFADQYIPFYEKLGEAINLRGIKLGRIEALLNLNRLDAAANALADPTLPGDPVNDIELARLQRRMRQLLAPISQDQSAGAAADDPLDETLVTRAVAALGQLASGMPEEEQLKNLVQGLANAPPFDPNDPAGFEQLLKSLKQGEDFMRRGGSTDSQLTIRARIREASAIFAPPRRPLPDEIRKSLATLEQSLTWARVNGVIELQNDGLYGIYLCHSRLNAPSPAADALLQLRANLEATRSAITDVTRRGGAFGAYPYLFAALCEKLHATGRVNELLEAIEASKGRGVADLLTQRSGEAVTDASIYGAVTRIPDLCRQHRFNYLSYFVDDDQTYAVLVTTNGQIHAPAPVPLSRAAIRQAASAVTPETASQLSPLVEWLEPLIDAGTILAGTHLCIAPDDDLANLPFSCLTLRGGPLTDTLSVSRTHNALHLQHLLERTADRPRSYFGVIVAARDNVASPKWPQMHASLRKPIERVSRHLPGETMEGETASVAAVAQHELTGRVVHFSSHGMFPLKELDRSPFDYSGLLLADGAALPDTKAIDIATVLTPRTVLDRNLDFTGSHVSMMACVSGLSREGVGGDALGMEWAMIQGGAASVLSTHWDVSAQLAAAFLDLFYEQWLGQNQSRAKAFGATIASLRSAGGRGGEMASWAAFSLTGDWR
jgi:CHAT domain-containing protein